MAVSAFEHQDPVPTDDALTAVLGPARAWWDQLTETASREHAAGVRQWRSYGKPSGWGLNLKGPRGTLAYLYPHAGSFTVIVVLVTHEVKAAQRAGLPPALALAIEDARPYVKGRSVHLPVQAPEDLDLVSRLLRLKAG